MSKLHFDIRPFAESDLASLHFIREAAFAPVFRSFRALVGANLAKIVYATAEEDQGEWLDMMCDAKSHHRVLVATTSDHVVGFCGYSIDTRIALGELGLNAVLPEFSGQGIGSAIYEYAIDMMRADGAKAAIVGTGSDASHAAARRAYEKAGFLAAVPSVHLSRTI
ncbi:GNAT family N-acetyltransferase [Erythrobacter rubeus]|uniref:GNAT family N-acetyltransferase n=1 Tax=Erythrobacter rubeus TaxID=2760803 RepID=A0ABR8KU61_9SPHN|nr:GNAT family N-acetyltransferase [Erythrobacter rubeus]MBD2843135.1 GNAT family N-acetyltransferase [Erythrobacter rubeus]